ncbi:uncharacterized protein TERG_03108 [Trichophyton rubrum CBS 118892]|uniref:Uncharacterized protein n=1 Tax=Trichophyton rubrum (strain ATCC MYA-4607 / CBS 118892) TaxID=559305 RepID=F2SMK1_TRIRC|nr:uncharacterized protein TERG_03108 [Trichophyton rubrum CBS 118892]EGD86853.2 hypothetical protein TERG_03108 [Trichophyton rubrum CBS 118892]
MPPSISTDGPRRLFQNPYLRLIGQGNAAVSVFLVLLGFVNSLKTIQLIRSGCHQDALSTLSVGAFRRTGRLMLPATAATLVSFSLCNLGLYGLARSSDAYWTMTTAAAPSPTILEGIKSVAWEMIAVWIVGENRYDQPQWALAHLFKGSFFIYMPQFRPLPPHGMLMRTVLVWLVFGPNYLLGITKPGKLADGTDGQVVPQPGDLIIACLLPVFFAILLFVCSLWNRFVEPYFGYATASLESFAKSFCRNQWPFNSLNSMPNGEKSILPTTRRD